jgi:hypothetical protein
MSANHLPVVKYIYETVPVWDCLDISTELLKENLHKKFSTFFQSIR